MNLESAVGRKLAQFGAVTWQRDLPCWASVRCHRRLRQVRHQQEVWPLLRRRAGRRDRRWLEEVFLLPVRRGHLREVRQMDRPVPPCRRRQVGRPEPPRRQE